MWQGKQQNPENREKGKKQIFKVKNMILEYTNKYKYLDEILNKQNK